MGAVVMKAGEEAIAAGARRLRQGRLVAFPTETVYGLGADASDGAAVARIFAAKGRPRFNPLIVHVLDLAVAEQLAVLTPMARRLVAAFWPGPLTIVATRRPDAHLSDLVSAGLSTVALRSPDHPVARALLAAASLPVAAPSANRSGHVSATRAEHVAQDLAAADVLVIDGGATAHGLESTVLDTTGTVPTLLRPGAVPAETIEAVLGLPIARASEASSPHGVAAPVSPGQLESHYAPRARVRLAATDVRPGEALLAFGPALATSGPAINLSTAGDTIEAAAGLFAALRALDATGAHTIAVMAIPDAGLGEAINDRLRRAAAGR